MQLEIWGTVRQIILLYGRLFAKLLIHINMVKCLSLQNPSTYLAEIQPHFLPVERRPSLQFWFQFPVWFRRRSGK